MRSRYFQSAKTQALFDLVKYFAGISGRVWFVCAVSLVLLFWLVYRPNLSTRLPLMSSTKSRDEPSMSSMQIPFAVNGDNFAIEAITVPSTQRHTVVVLIHGADRKLQNAKYWTPHLPFFAERSQVYAVSLLGHGASTPGESDSLPQKRDGLRHVDAVLALLRHVGAIPRLDNTDTTTITAATTTSSAKTPTTAALPRIILVGRSWGGSIALQVSAALHALRSDAPHALILIAPAITPEAVVQNLANDSFRTRLPVLLCWADGDHVIPYSRAPAIQRAFGDRAQLFTFRGETSHVPELRQPAVWHSALLPFWQSLLPQQSGSAV